MKIALNVLAYNETDCLDKCLESAKGLVDEIYVGYSGGKDYPATEKILKKHGVTIVPIKPIQPIDNGGTGFSVARNTLQKATKADLIFWVDSDDIIQLNEGVRRSEVLFKIKKTFNSSPALGSLWSIYYYDFDKNGNCINTVERERVYRKDYYEWIGKLHEVAIPTVGMGWARQDLFTIKHNTTHERMVASSERNLKMSLFIYDEEKKEGKLTYRTAMNLARSLVVMKGVQYSGQVMRGMDAALPMYFEALSLADNDVDRCDVLLKVAEIYRRSRKVDEALKMDAEVIRLKPHWPDGHIGLGDSYKMIDRYKEAIECYKTSLTKTYSADDMLGADPTKYSLGVYKSLAFCLFFSMQGKEALEYVKKAICISKADYDMLSLQTIIEDALNKQRMTDNIIEIKTLLEKEKEFGKIKYLSKMLPSWMESEPFAVQLKNEFDPKFEKNTMIVYCGETYKAWSPESAKHGIGGSEEMVIYLTRELAALGWNITVYCSCDKPGNYAGVEYKEYWSYIPSLPSDVFIAWRNEDFLEVAPKTGKKYLWLHDVKEDKMWKPHLTTKADKIFFLSKFHRSILTLVPDDKVWITRNGILPEHFTQFDDSNRIKNRCVFVSSPVRGLAILLDCWEEIRKAIPDATLQIYYGFDVWDAQHGTDSVWVKRKQDMLAKIQALGPMGVQYIGNVGHLELAQAMANAEYWTNPNFVFDEISCISAMKAQASGCWPITSNRAALGETTKNGTIVPYVNTDSVEDVKKKFTKACIDTMKRGITDEERKNMKEEARQIFSMASLAKEWTEFMGGTK
jgi:glycosyltransferase involved in cell wall biosynthesis